mgnify:CR=1 FL=1
MCLPLIKLRDEWKNANINEFHIHIYKNDSNDDMKLAQQLLRRQGLKSSWHFKGPFDVGAVGPHVKSNTELNLVGDKSRSELQSVLFEIQLFNQRLQAQGKAPLSVLVHPETGDFIRDHNEKNVKWFGKMLPFNQAFIDRFLPPKASSTFKR